MQKLLAALFAAALMFGTVACTVEDDDPEGGTTVIEGEEGEAEGETDVEVDAEAEAEEETS